MFPNDSATIFSFFLLSLEIKYPIVILSFFKYHDRIGIYGGKSVCDRACKQM